MTPDDEIRLSSWLLEIAAALLCGVQPHREGADVLRFPGAGGLTINTRTVFWRLWSAARSHWSALPLIELLTNCTRAEAIAWGTAWLASHPGTGSCGTGDNVDDETDTDLERAEYARDLMGRMVPLAGTPAETYLDSRRIWRDGLPDSLGFIADVRVGEGAFAAMLSFRGRIVGLQVLHIDSLGRKSTIPPVRRRFMLEKAAGAAFHLERPPGVYTTTNFIINDGVEDALSTGILGQAAEILGTPGVGTIPHLDIPRGTDILVVRDGDAPGSGADQGLIKGLDHLLLSGAASVLVTQTPPGEDANSILLSGGPEALAALLDAAVPATLSPEGDITRLARLADLDYEAVRKTEADRLGIRVSILDKSVGAKRTRARPAAEDIVGPRGQGRPIEFPVIDPWPEPIDGATLLTAISETVRKYVWIEPFQADATAMFVVFTHAFEAFDHAPKLVLQSPQKRSGKTRKLEVLDRLVPRPMFTSGIGPAALIRLIEQHQPTLLLDEIDALMKSGAETTEALRGILDGGFGRRGANYVKSAPLPGGSWESRVFSTWCPQVLSGIGSLPDSISDRSVVIEMKRKRLDEKVQRLRSRDGDDLRDLARKAARWVGDHLIALGAADPTPVAELHDRAADAWAPLFAIADAAGGDWPKRGRDAARRLAGTEDTETTETELLADIRDAFGTKEHLSSETLVGYLIGREDRPWAEIAHGRPLTKHGLARRLRPFHISPGTIRVDSTLTSKGYKRTQFADAWERYLSPTPRNPPFQTVTTSQVAENKAFRADSEPEHTTPCCGLKTAGNTSVSAACDGVTVQITGNGGVREDIAVESPPRAPVPNGEDRPIGADIATSERRLSAIDQHILAFAKANPGCSVEQVAKKVGQPKAVVATVLGRPLP